VCLCLARTAEAGDAAGVTAGRELLDEMQVAQTFFEDEDDEAQDVSGRHDIQDRQPGHGAGVVHHQAIRHPCAVVMADRPELLEAELAHERGLVASHGSAWHKPGLRRPGRAHLPESS